jgi:hypothetical protein
MAKQLQIRLQLDHMNHDIEHLRVRKTMNAIAIIDHQTLTRVVVFVDRAPYTVY